MLMLLTMANILSFVDKREHMNYQRLLVETLHVTSKNWLISEISIYHTSE